MHQALHDTLTGLPNRAQLNHRLREAVAVGRRASQTFALLLVDLDHFKDVNDTLGHHAGDQLLVELARRLQASGSGWRHGRPSWRRRVRAAPARRDRPHRRGRGGGSH